MKDSATHIDIEIVENNYFEIVYEAEVRTNGHYYIIKRNVSKSAICFDNAFDHLAYSLIKEKGDL